MRPRDSKEKSLPYCSKKLISMKVGPGHNYPAEMVENKLRGAVEVEENRRSGPVATFTTHDEGIESREGEDNPVATPTTHDEGIEKLQVRMTYRVQMLQVKGNNTRPMMN